MSRHHELIAQIEAVKHQYPLLYEEFEYRGDRVRVLERILDRHRRAFLAIITAAKRHV